MTNPKIEKALNDPDTVMLLVSAIKNFSSIELLVIKKNLSKDRATWAHHQRQMDESRRISYAAWKAGMRNV